LVILGTLVAPETGNLSRAVFVLIHMLWGVGIGLYASLATLLIYRIFFFAIGPDDLTPLLWVVMGAAANQHQCRIDSPTHRQWHAVPALDAPIHRRCDARLMGMGYLVDSAVAALWDLEARHMPCALDIYPDALEYRFPAWDVFDRQPAVLACS
jgi:hypothetical protein